MSPVFSQTICPYTGVVSYFYRILQMTISGAFSVWLYIHWFYMRLPCVFIWPGEIKTSTYDHPLIQEGELAAAAEKLAECQETILLLGRQLKALHPQGDLHTRTSIGDDEPVTSSEKLLELDHPETDGVDSSDPDLLSNLWSPSDARADIMRSPPANSKLLKHRPSLSGSSSSSSSTMTPEKQSRGFSRFFSSTGKNIRY